MRKIIHISSIIALVLCYIIVAVVAYWLFYPYKVIEYETLPLPVRDKAVRQGGEVMLHHQFCKFSDTQVTALVELEDGIIYNIGKLESNSQPGCYDRWSSLMLPDRFRPGEKGRIHYTLVYKVNPIREIKYHIYSEPFEVIP